MWIERSNIEIKYDEFFLGTITCRHIIYFIANAIILVIEENPNKQHDIDQIEATEHRGPDQANQASQWKYLSTHMEHLLN